ncbi:MAG: hypothetical protein RJA80_174 [Actinomycetota bacterium]
MLDDWQQSITTIQEFIEFLKYPNLTESFLPLLFIQQIEEQLRLQGNLVSQKLMEAIG